MALHVFDVQRFSAERWPRHPNDLFPEGLQSALSLVPQSGGNCAGEANPVSGGPVRSLRRVRGCMPACGACAGRSGKPSVFAGALHGLQRLCRGVPG